MDRNGNICLEDEFLNSHHLSIKPVPGSRSVGKIEQAGGQPAGSATSPFSLPDHTRLVSSPLFRSSTLTESLEQTIVCSIKHWRFNEK